MRKLTELPAWERLFKKILWKQLGNISGKYILDFGSGEGITANHFAKDNKVIAVEPWEEMLKNVWRDYEYKQIIGDLSALFNFSDNTFDIVFCHNVLEYVDDKAEVMHELSRILKPDGVLSLVKHNRIGRVMQMAVLLDDFEKANALLDGEDGMASKFGKIQYYKEGQIEKWCPELSCEKIYGIRTFWDLQQNQGRHSDENWQDEMMKLEMRVSELDEFRDISFFHHLILRKTDLI